MSQRQEQNGPAWTTRRRLLFALLCAHWVSILLFALPDPGWRTPLLSLALPLLKPNTHTGERTVSIERQSLVQWYLTLSSQYQRWKMFIPRRPNLTYLELQYDDHAGNATRMRLLAAAKYGYPRKARWVYLESALLNPDRRGSYLPAAVPVLFNRFAAEPASSVRALKLAYPIPLLKPDASGNPQFTNSDEWVTTSLDRDKFIVIPMGEYPLVGVAQ